MDEQNEAEGSAGMKRWATEITLSHRAKHAWVESQGEARRVGWDSMEHITTEALE